jgi:hypothetical protein
MALGTDVVETAETLCLAVSREFKRLQWAGRTMVTMPIRVREAA